MSQLSSELVSVIEASWSVFSKLTKENRYVNLLTQSTVNLIFEHIDTRRVFQVMNMIDLDLGLSKEVHSALRVLIDLYDSEELDFDEANDQLIGSEVSADDMLKAIQYLQPQS